MWKRDYLRHGIENAVRASLSDARLPRFWSGSRFDIVPFDPQDPRRAGRETAADLSLSFSRFLYRAAIGEELLKP